MRRTDRLRWSQLKIGILLVVGFLILLWVAFNSGLPKFLREEEPMTARFASAEGLLTGAPVFFLGIEAGSVQSVTFDPGPDPQPIVVRFEVIDRVRRDLRADAAVRISSLGLLGDKILVLDRGDDAGPLARNAVLRGASESEFSDLIEPGRRTVTKLEGLLTELEAITIGIREGQGTVGQLLTQDEAHRELVTTLAETRRVMADFRKTQNAVGAQLTSTARSFDSLAVAFRTGDGTLARMRNDPSLYDNLNGAAARLERVLTEMESGEGLFARALRDPELADQFTGLIVDLRALLQDMRENPGKYVQFSVF